MWRKRKLLGLKKKEKKKEKKKGEKKSDLCDTDNGPFLLMWPYLNA